MTLLTIELLIKIICIILPLLIAIAYFTLAERKIMAAIQRRRGPNVVGFLGLLQPLADGVKLIVKETTVPSNANKILFNIAPILTFFLSLLSWAVIPFGDGIVLSDINLGLMYIFAISSLGVYGVIIAGWSSNSKYAFLGALRCAAQMISYELTMGFIIINIVIMAGSFNLSDIVKSQDYIWYAIPQLPMFGMFFVCALAETNRHPFDLMEAEAELVSGFNVEYSAVGFAMFFLGEYGNILLMCSLMAILFLGGWQAPIFFLDWIPGPIWFGIKIACFVVLFIWVRAAYPRYRYDQLMRLGWKVFLPLSFAYLILTASTHVMDLTPNKFYELAHNPGDYIHFNETIKLPIKAGEHLAYFAREVHLNCLQALSHCWYAIEANNANLFPLLVKTYALNYEKLQNVPLSLALFQDALTSCEFAHYLDQIMPLSDNDFSLKTQLKQDLILHFKMSQANQTFDFTAFYEGTTESKFLANLNKLTNSNFTIFDLPELKNELNQLVAQAKNQ